MELLLTRTSHIRTINLTCTDFKHCRANVRGTIYKWGSWTIYSCKRASAVCLITTSTNCSYMYNWVWRTERCISGTDHVYIACSKRVCGRAPGRWGVIREGSRMRGECVGEKYNKDRQSGSVWLNCHLKNPKTMSNFAFLKPMLLV